MMQKRGDSNFMGKMVLIGVVFFLFLFVLLPNMQGTLYAAQSKQICNMDRALGSGAQCVSDEIVLKGSQDQSNKAIAEILFIGIQEAKKDALDGIQFIKNPLSPPDALEDPTCWTLAIFKFEGDGKSDYKDQMSLYEWMERNMIKSTTASATYSRYIHDAIVSDGIMIDLNFRENGEVGQINPSNEYRIIVRRVSSLTKWASQMKSEYEEYIRKGEFRYEDIPTAGGISPDKIRRLLEEGKPRYQVVIVSDNVYITCKRKMGDN